MNKKLSKNRKLKNDVVLAVVITLLATAGLLLFNLLKTQGDYVSVKINGEEKYRYSLSENVDMVIYTGENNNQENRLIIENNQAYIISASCPDKICVGHKPVSNVNESIVCLPHKVVVEIVSNEAENAPDVVV